MTFDKTRRKRSGMILITVGVTAFLCILFFLIFGSELLLNPNRGFEPQQTMVQKNINESISIPGFEDMRIPAGKTSVPVYLYNPEDNKCYFEISIILSGTNDEIYKSKLVSPGGKLYQIELKRALEKGSYDAVVHYNTYTLEDYTATNGANVPFKLIVE